LASHRTASKIEARGAPSDRGYRPAPALHAAISCKPPTVSVGDAVDALRSAVKRSTASAAICR
jgi:hypothetical protein